MSGNSKVTKATLQQRIRGLIAGTQKHAPSGSLTLGSTTYTAAALVQLLQSLADALDAADAAKASWEGALKKVNDTEANVEPVIRDYEAWVLATNRGSPSTLADYGVKPRKVPVPLTAEQKAAAAQKRTATRAARHTMGKVQKKKVTGTVATTAAPASTTAPQPVAQSPAANVPPQGATGAAAPRTS